MIPPDDHSICHSIMQMSTTTPSILNSTHLTNTTTSLNALQWESDTTISQRPALIMCLFATITHTLFWIQVSIYPSYRQRNMQWIYVYLITDQLLIIRYFFSYIIHTSFYQTASNDAWTTFVCFIDAAVDNYLNILAIYILLAINICRYFQIVYNQNLYEKKIYILIIAHFVIYLTPLLLLLIQLAKGWAELVKFPGANCDIGYVTIATQIINVVHSYALPILLNVLVILLNLYHVHLKTNQRRAEIRISARDKYHRSLAIQFLLFYIIWLIFWSPDVLVYQFTAGESVWTDIASILNYVGITLDPIVVAALDVRVRRGWISMWHSITRLYTDAPVRIVPVETNHKEETRF